MLEKTISHRKEGNRLSALDPAMMCTTITGIKKILNNVSIQPMLIPMMMIDSIVARMKNKENVAFIINIMRKKLFF